MQTCPEKECRVPEVERRRCILEASFRVACQEGIEGLTVRHVAASAGVSHGLVHHYFKTKEALLFELLNWLIDTMVRPIPDEGGSNDNRTFVDAAEEAIGRVFAQPDRMRLFLDFWALGLQHPDIRRRMRRELAEYREAFTSFGLRASENRGCGHSGTDPGALSALVVAVITGCAVQAAMDPGRFDPEGVKRSLRQLLSGVERSRETDAP